MKKTRYPFRNKEAEEKSMAEAAVHALEMMPTSALLHTIETIVEVLIKRGQPIRDFDNKEKIVQQVRLIGRQAYFLAAKPEGDVGKYISDLQQEKEDRRLLSKEIIKVRRRNMELEEKLRIAEKKLGERQA